MMNLYKLAIYLLSPTILWSCQSNSQQSQDQPTTYKDSLGNTVLQPVIVTDTTLHDTDDPAIWINPEDPAKSLVIGTDKDEENGGLYVFDLEGNILKDKCRLGLKRTNNVDVEYGLKLEGKEVDIAVTTERKRNALRIYTVPDMQEIDGGGIPVFEGEEEKSPMGIALYKDPATQNIYAIVGRKSGPQQGYLWQYLLEDDGSGQVKATKIRAFGQYSGIKEIEAIAVDDALGYVYYSDENVGVRKYYVHPDSSDTQLALFANTGFTDDHEGISIYQETDSTGYILVSDQQANKFHLFTREGTQGAPHDHQEVKVVSLATRESDGSEVTSVPLNDQFKHGLFVAMSDDQTFQYYRWEDLIEVAVTP